MRTGMTVIREHSGFKFYGEIANDDIVSLNLDPLDRALMNDVPLDAPPADILLVLEMIFRRLYESRLTKKKPAEAG